jgi:hypothetical protein
MQKLLNCDMVIEPRNGGYHMQVVASPADDEPPAGLVTRGAGEESLCPGGGGQYGI